MRKAPHKLTPKTLRTALKDRCDKCNKSIKQSKLHKVITTSGYMLICKVCMADMSIIERELRHGLDFTNTKVNGKDHTWLE